MDLHNWRVNIFKTHKTALIFASYPLLSFMLSFAIFLRLQRILPTEIIKYVSFAIIFLGFLSILAFVVLLSALALPFASKNKRDDRKMQALFAFPLVSYLLFLVALLIIGISEYFALSVPIIIPLLIYLVKYKPKENLSRRKVGALLIFTLSISILMPPLTAYACYNTLLSQASSKDEFGKAMFISDFVRATNLNFPLLDPFRANKDFWKYLIVGVGACGEMEMATSTFLNKLGFQTREVRFPGENHAFTEVEINGTWMVLDPGYFQSRILTREERAAERIKEFGAISYVITYVDGSFVELTNYYVPTDTIKITVTSNGEPLANAHVYLTHKFMSSIWRLPDESQTFILDSNGTIILRMGKLSYNDKAKEYDDCYWINVNGIDTGYNITSTGTDKEQLVRIDLMP